MREYLHFQEAKLIIGIQEQVAVLSPSWRELIRERASVPAGIRIEVVIRGVSVGGVVIGVHEHRELEFFGPCGIEYRVTMPVVLRVPGIAIIKRDMGRNQANLLEVNGRLDVNGKLPEEGIIQVNFDEVLFLVIQVGQHQAKEALRRIRALGCVRAMVLKSHRLQFFLVNELQLEGNRRTAGNLSITLRTIAIGLRFWFRIWFRIWLRVRLRFRIWLWIRFRF